MHASVDGQAIQRCLDTDGSEWHGLKQEVVVNPHTIRAHQLQVTPVGFLTLMVTCQLTQEVESL